MPLTDTACRQAKSTDKPFKLADGGVRVHRPREIDVKAVRAKVGMTQEQFAARFGFSTATLRHGARGDRSPRGPARVLLNVIEHNPEAVIEALA